MAVSVAGPEIERLIQLLARMPGLGPRSARRAALHLIKKRDTLLAPLSEAMRVASERIVVCSTCGNVDTSDPCTICADPQRDPGIIVVVEDVSDLWALERAGALTEILLALNATVDGQTTAHYITELLAHLPVRVTRLAHGVPVGGELDYLDEGTLSAAIRQRTAL
jgi:recombination protein RecR